MTKNNITQTKTVTGEGNALRVDVVRILNETLNYRIEKTPQGYALYNCFGYSGTFPTESAALRHDNADHIIPQ